MGQSPISFVVVGFLRAFLLYAMCHNHSWDFNIGDSGNDNKALILHVSHQESVNVLCLNCSSCQLHLYVYVCVTPGLWYLSKNKGCKKNNNWRERCTSTAPPVLKGLTSVQLCPFKDLSWQSHRGCLTQIWR